MVGTVDVDGLLAAMPRRLFREWQAYYRIEPFGDEWDQAGTVAAAAHNAAFIASGRYEVPPELLALREPRSFVPGRKVATPRRAIPLDQDEATMARLYG